MTVKLPRSCATDFGHLCPVSMAYAVVPTLKAAPDERGAEPILDETYAVTETDQY